MPHESRIGIVMPAFNAALWIGDAIASVIAQTHRDWSLVVVDDGSTDGTAEVVEGFGDPRARLVRQPNAGVSAARNRGVVELCGDTPTPTLSRKAGEGWGGGVASLFLDADDWLASDALANLLDALITSPGAVAASGAYTFVDTSTVRIPPAGDILPRLLVRNLFANGGHVLIRTEVLQRAGGFLSDIAYGEDWEFWIRIALQGPFVTTRGHAPVLFVRQHAGSAYHRLAANPDAFGPCMAAIFANPALHARFGPAHLETIRQRTDAENTWVIGRELIRHGRGLDGLGRLRRSFAAQPSLRRSILLAAAHMLPVLPMRWRGPFRPYPAQRA